MTDWLILADHVSPYTLDLWDRVAQHDPSQRVTLVSWSRAVRSDFAHEEGLDGPASVRRIRLESSADLLRLKRGLTGRDPDVVVCLGYTRLLNLALCAAAHLRTRRRPVLVYMADTNGLALIEQATHAVGSLGLLQLKRLVLPRLFDTAFTLGLTNSLANAALGIRDQRHLPLYTVDFAAMGRCTLSLEHERRLRALRPPILLQVARLEPEKNPVELAKEWAELARSKTEGSLVFVGDGSQRSLVQDALATTPSDRYLIAGSVRYDQVGGFFRNCAASCLVSAREPWGIAAVEALGLGRPLLASREVGAAVSLAMERPGGIRIWDPSRERLGEALARFLVDLPSLRQAAASAAGSVIELYDRDRVAERLCAWGAAIHSRRLSS